MPERLRVWLWNLTVNLAWAILRRLGASAIDVHRAGDEPDDVDVLRAQLESWRDWYDDYREVLGVRAPEEASDAYS